MTATAESPAALAGQVASRGLAVGPLHILGEEKARSRAHGDAAQEAAALRAAVARAAEDLAALIAAQDGDDEAAAILEVQLAFLEDDGLTEGAYEAIAGGAAAEDAWRAALDEQIRDYEAAEDEYFRARASDLADLRDRVLDHLFGSGPAAVSPCPAGAILVADDLTPSRFLGLDWSAGGGLALSRGSPTSHVAMLARARGVPMLTGLGPACLTLTPGGAAVLDADAGRLEPAPTEARLRAAAARIEEAAARRAREDAHRAGPAVTADGVALTVLANLEELGQLDALDPAICDGIGLLRTEFLFAGDRALPSEDTQYAAYVRFLDWAAGRPVTIRTLDAGGDKPVPGLTPEGEANPFLGVRGLRLSLRHRAVFEVQLRALARAAAVARGPFGVMFPMVTTPAEFAAARAIFEETVAALAAEGIDAARPAIGMMVEVPAAAIRIEDFDADFYSIGSNDLIQYVLACSRDNAALRDMFDGCDPAVLELIARVVAHGRATGRPVSLCGDMAGDVDALGPLLGCGLRSFSVAPAAIGRLKAAIAATRLDGKEGEDG